MRYAVCAAALLMSGLLWSQNPKAPGALKLIEPVISQFEDGPALGAQKVIPGETVFFRFGAVNFKLGENGRVQLTGHVQAFDPNGKAIASRDEVVIATSLNEEDKNWKPRLRSQLQLPAIAPPGKYTIRFEAVDDQNHQTESGEVSFGVEGKNVPLSPVLAIRELAFYRTADDETPLKVPAYRPGDMVWVRFDVTGYKYGEQNAIDVAYDVAVLTGEGKQLFMQENAAVEKSQAFYPQPWVPGSFSLTLQTTMHPGNYTVAVIARDGIGNQTATEKAVFKVE